MNSEQITAFLQAHWEWVTLIMGIVSDKELVRFPKVLISLIIGDDVF